MNASRLSTALSFVIAGTALFNARAEFVPQVYQGAEERSLNYRIHLPEKTEAGKKYPLILLLHGAGERGDDNQKQLKYGTANLLDYSIKNNQPAIIVVPQCPAGQQWVNVPWTGDSHTMPEKPSDPMQLVMELLQKIIKEQPVDPDRIYVTGMSMGGFGTWDILQRNPELFAAAVPICGGGDPAYANAIKNIPVWVFHGDIDPTVQTKRSREMVHALKQAGGHPRYTEYPNTKHNSWTPTYANTDVLKWLFDQKKARP